jgi:hypothetical protein
LYVLMSLVRLAARGARLRCAARRVARAAARAALYLGNG